MRAGSTPSNGVAARPAERQPRRVLAGEPLEALPDPRRHVVERVRVGVQEALALNERIPPEDVDVLRASLVGGARDRTCAFLHAEVCGHAEDLPRLEIAAEADEQVGEALDIGGAVAHRGGRLPPCGSTHTWLGRGLRRGARPTS